MAGAVDETLVPTHGAILMKKLSVAAGLVLALSAGSAFAADLPSRKGPPAYLPPPPMFSWTGLYGGVNIGYGFGASSTESGWLIDAAGVNPAFWGGNNQNLNGVLGGGQVGYNYQFSPWLVVGVEADLQAADLNTQSTLLGGGVPGINFAHVNSAKSVDWFGTVRGRLGLTLPSMPNLMFFGTGGFAYGQVDHTVSLSNVYGVGVVTGKSKYFDTATGWAAGGGVEWTPMAFPAWSLKVEYLYTDLGSSSQTNYGFLTNNGALPPFIGQHASSTRFHTVRAGLNWHFNPFASAPVLAKY